MMDEKTFKNLIPAYIENDLQDTENKEFIEYLKNHPDMQAEINAYKKTWEMLDELDPIEPNPNYISNFWSKLGAQRPWYEELPARLNHAFSSPRLTPALASICAIILIGIFVLKGFQTSDMIASVDESEFEIVADMDLAENIDLIEDIEFYEDLEVIENYDPQQSKRPLWIKEKFSYTSV